MKINKLFYIFITVFSLVMFGFVSCDNIARSINSDKDNGSKKEETMPSCTRVFLGVGNLHARSAITPEDLVIGDINKACVLADNEVIGTWTTNGSANALTNMSNDNSILIDAGIYTFTLYLYDSENNLVAVSVIENALITPGDNRLNFTTKTPSEGSGKIELTLNWEESQRIGKVMAGLFTLADDTVALEGFGYQNCTPAGSTSAKYSKENVPCGQYYIKFDIYATDNVTVINNYIDVVVVEAGRVSSDSRDLNKINTLYSIVYDKAGGEYIEGYTPVTVHNAYTGVLLPTAAKIKKTGYDFGDWYDSKLADSEISTRRMLLPDSPYIAQDNSYVAQWKAQVYTITYKDKGNVQLSGKNPESSPALHVYDTKTVLPVPAKTGYIFNGWFTNPDCTGSAISAINGKDITENITLYAKWSPITYTVHFNKNDNAVGSDFYVTGAYKDIVLSYDESFRLKDCISINDDVTEAFKYLSHADNSEAGKFTGWAGSSNGRLLYANKGTLINLTTENNAEITLYAKWVSGEYAIAFDANGGTGVTNGLDASVSDPTPLTKNTFEKTGYTFANWNLEGDGSGESYNDEEAVRLSTSVGEVITLYAQWAPNNYTVHFNESGSRINAAAGTDSSMTGTGSVADFNCVYDKAAALPSQTFTAPTGYEFYKWNTKQDGTGVSYAPGDEVLNLTDKGTVELYPMFKPVTFRVVYNKNSSYATGSMPIQYVDYDSETLVSIGTFARTGYSLKGWALTSNGSIEKNVDDAKLNYTAQGEKQNLASTADAQVTLYAVWEPVTYTVKYEANGGTFTSGNSEPQTHVYDTTYESPSLTKTGYNFKGWAKVSNAIEPLAGLSNSIVKNAGSFQNQEITLYAVWGLEEYEITYKDQNGVPFSGLWKNTTYNKTYNFVEETVLPTPDDFFRQGYAFDGWYEDSSCTGSAVTKIPVNQTGSKTLYAKWRPNCSTLTLSDTFVLFTSRGSSKTITAKPKFNGAVPNYFTSWKSADPSIATVTNGVIKAVRSGTTTVTAKVDDKIATCVVVVTPDNGKLEYDTGSKPTSFGGKTYYSNNQQLIAFYTNDSGNIDFIGRKNTTDSWKQTSYGNYGWSQKAQSNGGSLRVSVKPVIAYDTQTNVSYVVMYFILTNPDELNTYTYSYGMHSDVQLGRNDYAPIDRTSYGYRMYDTEAGFELQAHMVPTTYAEVTTVDHYWSGHYSIRSSNTIGTGYGDGCVNIDSAMAFCWNDLHIGPGESVIKCVYFTLKAL